VFKVFSVATFFDRGVIKETDTFFCGGVYELRSGNETIRITCLDKHGTVTAREALEKSCNVALAQMSDRIDAQRFLAALGQLGFGKKTGIELPSESPGSVKTTSDKFWSARSKPTMSFGQEISVTALQVVGAATAIANNGVPMKLTVISGVTDREGRDIFTHRPEPLPRVFSPATAQYVLSCMKSTAERGTGSRAWLPDISIGVKTGTAQMGDTEAGGYSETDFISNCVAIFPVEDPKVVLYLVITKAQGENLAGRIAAPVVAEAAKVIKDHMGLGEGKPGPIKTTIPIQNITIGAVMPDLRGVPKNALIPLLARRDISINLTGEGYVMSQNPAPGTPVTENMRIELYLGDN
jgi:cell division protein FtsI (penicillin-binding protein 3)